MTKSALFPSDEREWKIMELGKHYVNEIFTIHGFPLSIISYHDIKFASSF